MIGHATRAESLLELQQNPLQHTIRIELAGARLWLLTISAPTVNPCESCMPRKAIDRIQERTMETLVAKHFTWVDERTRSAVGRMGVLEFGTKQQRPEKRRSSLRLRCSGRLHCCTVETSPRCPRI